MLPSSCSPGHWIDKRRQLLISCSSFVSTASPVIAAPKLSNATTIWPCRFWVAQREDTFFVYIPAFDAIQLVNCINCHCHIRFHRSTAVQVVRHRLESSILCQATVFKYLLQLLSSFPDCPFMFKNGFSTGFAVLGGFDCGKISSFVRRRLLPGMLVFTDRTLAVPKKGGCFASVHLLLKKYRVLELSSLISCTIAGPITYWAENSETRLVSCMHGTKVIIYF